MKKRNFRTVCPLVRVVINWWLVESVVAKWDTTKRYFSLVQLRYALPLRNIRRSWECIMTWFLLFLLCCIEVSTCGHPGPGIKKSLVHRKKRLDD